MSNHEQQQITLSQFIDFKSMEISKAMAKASEIADNLMAQIANLSKERDDLIAKVASMKAEIDELKTKGATKK